MTLEPGPARRTPCSHRARLRTSGSGCPPADGGAQVELACSLAARAARAFANASRRRWSSAGSVTRRLGLAITATPARRPGAGATARARETRRSIPVRVLVAWPRLGAATDSARARARFIRRFSSISCSTMLVRLTTTSSALCRGRRLLRLDPGRRSLSSATPSTRCFLSHGISSPRSPCRRYRGPRSHSISRYRGAYDPHGPARRQELRSTRSAFVAQISASSASLSTP